VAQSPARSRLLVFGLVWFGQLVSLVGSSLTSFALGVTILQSTGSTTRFSLLSFFVFAPIFALSPFAGAFVDRRDRRLVMLFSDLGGGIGSLLIWLLYTAGQTGRWHVETWYFYVPVALGSAAGAFRWPAYQASTTLLVPKQHLGRANGLIDLALGAGQVAAPVMAGALVGRIGLQGILILDLGSFLFCVVLLLWVRFPPHQRVGDRKSLLRDVAYGWSYIRSRPGLFWLMFFLASVNLVMSLVAVLITPLVLSFSTVTSLGLVLSLGGAGMLSGGVLMGIWGGGHRRMRTVVAFQFLGGLVLLLGGAPPTVGLIAVAASVFLFTIPFSTSTVQTIWQRKVPPGLQGRVFAVRRMVVLSAAPLATLLAGPLADRLFEPWLAPGGPLAGSVGRLVGTGPGRGIGLIFALLGLLFLGIAVAVRLSARVWNVEAELPDAVADEAPSRVAAQPRPGLAAGAGGAGT